MREFIENMEQELSTLEVNAEQREVALRAKITEAINGVFGGFYDELNDEHENLKERAADTLEMLRVSVKQYENLENKTQTLLEKAELVMAENDAKSKMIAELTQQLADKAEEVAQFQSDLQTIMESKAELIECAEAQEGPSLECGQPFKARRIHITPCDCGECEEQRIASQEKAKKSKKKEKNG